MTTHETVNKLYAEIQTLLRKNLGAEGKGFFALLKSVEGKLSVKLVWELRLIGAHGRRAPTVGLCGGEDLAL